MPSQSPKKSSKKRKTSRIQTTKRKQTPKKTTNRIKKDILIAFALLMIVAVSGAGYYINDGVPANMSRNGRPKLVIIIDDVATPKQLKEIQAVPLKLTPSIFPLSNCLRSTAKMAKKLKHYMIHFPMQAGNHPHGAMCNTVTIRDSKTKMRARVKDLRKWFPSCVYINNHTGSVFTSDYRALHMIYGLLKEEGFIFVDSRTSPKSKGERVASEYGDFYLYRDVFIDNVPKFGVIRKQLKIAVKKAKNRGYAIAIGHPHMITFWSLKNSLDILADVDVVYLDELMENFQ